MKSSAKILPHLLIMAYVVAIIIDMFVDVTDDLNVFILGLILLMLYVKE